MNIESLSATERKRLADTIANMSYEEQKQLLDQLSAPKAYNRIDARMENATYLRNRMQTKVAAELKRLGLSDGTVQASSAKKYAVYEIDKAMKAANWDGSHKMAFKSELSQLGMLA
jgi:hypothetical protein